jgi:hypothetical protein
MNRPIRTTIVFGLLSGLCLCPAAWFLSAYFGWTAAFKVVLWLDLALYALLLARWSGAHLAPLLFPLALLLGAAFWPRTGSGFLWLTLGVFCWIRSGICYRRAPLRALTAELITAVGGAGLVIMLWPQSAATQILAVWLFFLVQTLYFFILPAPAAANRTQVDADPFDQARQELERVLENGWSS